MSPWVVLLILILIILIVWWALLRNTRTETSDLHVHHQEAPVGSTEADALHSAYAVPSETHFVEQIEAAEPGPLDGELASVDSVRDDFAPHSGEAGGYKSAVIQEGRPDLAPPPPVKEPEHEQAPTPPAGPGPEAPHLASPPIQPDDLIIIEGIGPKINQLLQAAGITTFVQLADASVDHLRAILQPAGLGFHDPTTWPEQARLAAEGKLAELKAYQDRLRGGRSV